MSHKHMARGSKVAATLPAITAFAGKVRPAAIPTEARPFTSAPCTDQARARWSGKHRQRSERSIPDQDTQPTLHHAHSTPWTMCCMKEGAQLCAG